MSLNLQTKRQRKQRRVLGGLLLLRVWKGISDKVALKYRPEGSEHSRGEYSGHQKHK